MTKNELFKENLLKIIETIKKEHPEITFSGETTIYGKLYEHIVFTAQLDCSVCMSDKFVIISVMGVEKIYTGYNRRHSPKRDYKFMSGEICSHMNKLINCYHEKEVELKERIINNKLKSLSEDFKNA